MIALREKEKERVSPLTAVVANHVREVRGRTSRAKGERGNKKGKGRESPAVTSPNLGNPRMGVTVPIQNENVDRAVHSKCAAVRDPFFLIERQRAFPLRERGRRGKTDKAGSLQKGHR